MLSAQKHIINKLCIDVETSNPTSAFDLKDNIDTFLKHDILPYLENYFSMIEGDLHSQVIQIPYLSVNVDTSSTLNYNELKEDVKRALTKEIKRVTKIVHPHSEEVKLMTKEESKETSFLHFLETGTSPWWIKSKDTFELTEEDFEDFLSSKSFLSKLRSRLMNATFRNRTIHQLSDSQLVNVMKSIDSERAQKLWKKKLFKILEQTSSSDRKIFWDCLVDDILQKNDEVLVSRLIFQFIHKLSQSEYKDQITSTKDAAFFQVVIELLSSFYDVQRVQGTINIVKNSKSFEQLNFELKSASEIEPTIDFTNKKEKSVDKIEDKNQKINLEERSNQTEQVDSKEHKDEFIEAVQKSNQKVDEKRSEKTVEKDNAPEELDYEKSNEIIKESDISKEEMLSSKNAPETDQNVSTGKKEHERLDKEQMSLSELRASLSDLIEKEEHTLFEEINNVQVEETTYSQNEGEHHINNAGLILLHPYLKDFFKHCNVLDDKNQITDTTLAVHSLHYLATKKEGQFENNMVFEKVLCGVPIEQSIQRTIKLSDELKENAEELLQAVLDNWGALNNASPNLLRGEFLQRFGKISFKETNPKITVERKVHDILLNKLPWNIGISRLPWLDHLLFTDW